MRWAVWALACSLLGSALAADRSAAAVLAFKRRNPCPATGQRFGACPGWEIDHRVALCLHGPDTPDNMQWLSVPDHRAKTRRDVRWCRAMRNLNTSP